jgi:hypothetical protein
MPQLFVHGYALLVGVGRSSYPAWSLPVTVRDVRALKAVLGDPHYCGYINDPQHLRTLTDEDATKKNILHALETLEGAVAQDPEATVFIYYSGHGWLQNEDRYFLIPHDANPRTLASTALPAERFIQRLRRIRAKRLLVILDTCHAEGMAAAKNTMPVSFGVQAAPEDLVEQLSQGSGRVVFTSCRGEQSSWIFPDQSLSLFTHHLIGALKGAGSKAGEKAVRVSSLMQYVAQHVPDSARTLGQDQTPFFKIESEDFPVALACGGKGLTSVGPDKPEGRGPDRGTSKNTRMKAGRDLFAIDGNVGEIKTGR